MVERIVRVRKSFRHRVVSVIGERKLDVLYADPGPLRHDPVERGRGQVAQTGGPPRPDQ